MRGGAFWIDSNRSLEFMLRVVDPPRRKLLTPTANVRDGGLFGSCGVRVRSGLQAGPLQFQAQRGGIEFPHDTLTLDERIVLRVDFYRGQTVRAKECQSVIAFLRGSFLISLFFHGVNQECSVFRIVRFAVHCFAKLSGREGVFILGEIKKPEIEWVVILTRINVCRASQCGLRSREVTLAGTSKGKVIEYLRDIRTAHHIVPQTVLQSGEEFLGFVGLRQSQAADANGEKGLRAAIVSNRNTRKPGQSGITIAAHKVKLAQSVRRLWPIGLDSRRFLQIADAGF